jgi:hypothetical protein
MQDKLTDLWRNSLWQNDLINTFCETKQGEEAAKLHHRGSSGLADQAEAVWGNPKPLNLKS